MATEGHDIIVQVHEGDSTDAVAQTLADRDAVVTAGAFVEAAAENPAISAIQPGFYRVHTFISAGEAVDRRGRQPGRGGGELAKPSIGTQYPVRFAGAPPWKSP
ncbi:hypothetical protein [Mycolicibacterium tusciae]|uniref:hypothetical protein n=1 Tax=Mycolicibacterium tusciae TaxID=75922 RepID=UPI001A9899E5|nr:hypothetical protein [Mycolicibacterium tusciae]